MFVVYVMSTLHLLSLTYDCLEFQGRRGNDGPKGYPGISGPPGPVVNKVLMFKLLMTKPQHHYSTHTLLQMFDSI